MVEINLLDTWEARGTEFSELKQAIEAIADMTFTLPVKLSDIQLLSVCDTQPKAGAVRFFAHSVPRCLAKQPPACVNLLESAVLDGGGTQEIIDEMKEKTKLMCYIDKRAYFASGGLARDIGARVGLEGPGLNIPCSERNAYFVARFAEADQAVTAVVRQYKRTGKLIALASSNYAYIPQTILQDVIADFEAELGPAKCVFWSMNHEITRIIVSFPKKAEDIAKTYGRSGLAFPMPSMLLETSDTGACSVTATALWGLSSSYVRAETSARKHYGRINSEKIREQIRNTVWTTYTKLPERLCELAMLEVSDPTALIEEIFRIKIGGTSLQDMLGKRRTQAVREQLCAEINPTLAYSAYDIAMLFMEMPGRLVLSDGSFLKEHIEEIAYKVAFLGFEKLIETPRIALIPSAS